MRPLHHPSLSSVLPPLKLSHYGVFFPPLPLSISLHLFTSSISLGIFVCASGPFSFCTVLKTHSESPIQSIHLTLVQTRRGTEPVPATGPCSSAVWQCCFPLYSRRASCSDLGQWALSLFLPTGPVSKTWIRKDGT